MSTAHSSFDQYCCYCISHKTISYRAAAAPALKPTASAPWHNLQLCPSSQQILATPLPKRRRGGPLAPKLHHSVGNSNNAAVPGDWGTPFLGRSRALYPWLHSLDELGELPHKDNTTNIVLNTSTTLGRRVFSVAGTTVWNSLPGMLRYEAENTFRQSLKRLLFRQY